MGGLPGSLGVHLSASPLWTSPYLFLSEKGFVLVSCSCRNTLPPTEWLKATEMDSLTVLGARNPKAGCPQAALSPVSRPCPSQLLGLPALAGFLLHRGHRCLCPHMALSSVPESSSACSRTLILDGEHTWTLPFQESYFHLQRPFFKIRPRSQVWGPGREPISWGDSSQ